MTPGQRVRVPPSGREATAARVLVGAEDVAESVAAQSVQLTLADEIDVSRGTKADRVEKIRRVAEVARLMADAGLIVITAFISPFHSERDAARRRLPEGQFIEVHVDVPLAVAEARDAKGLYAKVRRGVVRS